VLFSGLVQEPTEQDAYDVRRQSAVSLSVEIIPIVNHDFN